MGLLDLFGQQDDQPQQGLLGMLGNPVNRALLAAGASALENSGPSLRPISTGQILGRMVGAGVNAYDSGVDLQQQQTLGGLKLRGLQQEQDQKQAMLDMQNRIRQRSTQTQDITGKPITPMQMAQMDGSSSQPAQQPFASAFPGGPMSPKIGGPDWMQAYQASQQPQPMTQPQAMSQSMPGASASANSPFPQIDTDSLNQRVAAHLARQAQIHIEEGDIDGGNKLYEQATKYLPEVNKIEAAQDPSGKPISVITFKDGTQRVSQFGPKPEIHFADDGQNTAIPINAYTGLAMGKGLKRQATPDAMLTSQYQNARLQFDRSQADNSAITQMTPDALKNAAARYNIDGTLPPMGMGKDGARYRTAILNEAAAQKAGVSPEQQRLDQLYNKGDAAARNASVRSFATGKDGQAVQAANTALNHLETIEQLAQAQRNKDLPAFNAIANRFAAATGQPAPTNLKTAIMMVAPEVSKAVIGAAGGQEERAQFAKNFNPDGSPEQIVQGVGAIKELMGGRLTEAQRSYERTTLRKDFRDTMLSPAAQRVLDLKRGEGGSDASAGQFSVVAPNGKTYSFSTAKDLANFKLSAGIK